MPAANVLAHEGNPRENTITITAGSVLSTASLEIQLLGGFRLPPIFVPGPGPGPGGGGPGTCCPDDLGSFGDLSFPNTISGCPTSCASFIVGCPDNIDQEIVRAFSGSFNLATGRSDHYGYCVTRLCCPVWPSGQSSTLPFGGTNDEFHCSVPAMQMQYDGVLEGFPRTGMILMKPGGTKDNLLAYAVIIDHQDNTVKFCKFINQSLIDISGELGSGSVIQSAAYPGTGVYFFTINLTNGEFLITGPPSGNTLFEGTDRSIKQEDNARSGGWWIGVCSIGSGILGPSRAKWSDMASECGLCHTAAGGATIFDVTCEQLYS